MIKYIIRILLLILLFSCGIPTYEYIDEPTVSDAKDTGYTFSIDLDDDGYINGFKIYSRYFIEESDDTESYFSDIDISDTDNDTEEFLEDLGYTVVSFINYDNVTNDMDYEDLDDSGYLIEQFDVSEDITFTVKYNSNDSITVTMYSDDDSTTYCLISNYEDDNDLIHVIGYYSDDNGENFLDEFDDGSDTSIYIEFAIFNTGLSSDLESLESLPVYASALDIQI